ncbi:MAG: carboxypeptidase-like regulatory domain-containing protein, partial [Myxococcota bacterium]
MGVLGVAILFGCTEPPKQPVPIPLRPKATSTTPAPGSTSGRVVDERGQPVAHATVTLMPRRPWPDRGSLSHRVTTDEEGRFTVPDEVSLPFGLTATAGLGSGSAGIIDDRESPLTITVKPSAIIVRGRVRDETGRVVGGVPVEVFQVPSEEIVFGTETDPKGGFVLVLPPAMSHLATVSPADRPRTLLRLESRAQSVNITVPNRPRPRPPETDLRAWLTSSVWPIRSTTPTGVVTDLAPVARAVERAR